MNRIHKTFVPIIMGAAIGLTAANGFAQVKADINGDCVVDVDDLFLLLSDWGPCPGCDADLDDNDVVDIDDLFMLLQDWGPIPCGIELAGNPLNGYPHFEYVRAFNASGVTGDIHLAIDPTRFPDIQGQTCDVYVVEAKNQTEWDSDPSLVDVTGSGPLTVTFNGADIQGNTFVIPNTGTLNADAGNSIGVGYDLVLDCDQNGELSGGDFIDGLSEEAGFYMVHDVTQPGPYAVNVTTYVAPGLPTGFNQQRAWYPANLDELGKSPVIIVSHGNGHFYQWYAHIGNHMASYGYVVMSHQNNTQPGVFSASTTTLQHTDAFFSQQATIAGGIFDGLIDEDNIVWIGHSRGGEGVVIAYNRLLNGTWTPNGWSPDGIRLISSIAPTDFLTLPQTNPHGVNYHLWTGGADNDVWGCANCNLCQTFHLHDRALEYRQSISLYGVGHGDFHDGGGPSVAFGPCLVGRPNTHAIMRGYFFPLVEHYVRDNIPAKDFLWRQWERFKPIGAPTSSCVVVNLMYREGNDAGKFVIDDHQSEFSTGTSSSGGAITTNVSNLLHGRLDDNNTTFTWTTTDPMNGMTVGGNGDFTRGVVFDWTSPAFYEYEIVPVARDFRQFEYFTFRAAQTTRHPYTNFDTTPLNFDIVLIDGNGDTSTINFSEYGGGIEHPYMRTGCGTGGGGWHNEFETIRIRLTDFLHNGSGIDLSDIEAIRFEFANPGATERGRIGIDDVELTGP